MSEIDIQQVLIENENLKQRINDLENSTGDICTAISQLAGAFEKSQHQIYELITRVKYSEARIRNYKYEYVKKEDNLFLPAFRSNEETLRLIKEEKKSMGRFGDGEFSIAYGLGRQKFQKPDEKLGERIRQVLNENNDKYIIAIANNYGNLDEYTEQIADGIRLYMDDETRQMHKDILPKNTTFSDAYITRPYVLYRDNMTDAPQKRFDELKKIWKEKNIIIVEGEQTRLGVRNDLFAGTESIRRIIAPATNSFDKYDEILEKCMELGQSADMFILAIGPSSGVLAFDLSMSGYQAIDVGHIDLEYEWFLRGQGKRTPVPYKYNNEISGGDTVESIDDPDYIHQIVAKFM